MGFNKQRDAADRGANHDERKAESTTVNLPLIVSRRTPSPWEAAVNLRLQPLHIVLTKDAAVYDIS